MTLSVVIITKDEEENIGRCLEQVKWADEIIVVDAHSQDKTVKIAKRYTDKVILHEWVSFPVQRSLALGLATCDFVLALDADEVLDKTVKDEIKKVLISEKYYDGYYITRETYFLGKRLFFSERSDRKMRFFRRAKGFIICEPLQLVHEEYGVDGHTKLFEGRIKHYTANTIAERIKKINAYSTLWAKEKADYGSRRPSFIKTTYIILKRFIGIFFIKRGYLDGFSGFVWCVLKALEGFLKYAKLWEKTI